MTVTGAPLSLILLGDTVSFLTVSAQQSPPSYRQDGVLNSGDESQYPSAMKLPRGDLNEEHSLRD